MSAAPLPCLPGVVLAQPPGASAAPGPPRQRHNLWTPCPLRWLERYAPFPCGGKESALSKE
jgi:hypothetical protein